MTHRAALTTAADPKPRPTAESAAAPEYPIYRGRDWLGRRSFVIHAGRRRLFYPTLPQARRAQARLRATGGRRPRRSGCFAPLAAGGVGLAALLLAAWLSPPFLLGSVDLVRGFVGPAPVAYVESAVFRANTLIRRARVGLGDTAPRWRLEVSPVAARPSATPRPAAAAPTRRASTAPPASATPRPLPSATALPVAVPKEPAATPHPTIRLAAPSPTLTLTPAPLAPPATPVPPGSATRPRPAPRAGWPPAPLPALIDDGQLPDEGIWQPLPSIGDGGAAAMAVTVLRPDPARPDIQVAIVAIDLDRALLHIVAGVEEPPVVTGTLAYRPARIPPETQASNRLLAAFNGAFKAIHGADGMFADGEEYLPPVPGRATVGVLRDGSVQLGIWGRDIGPDDGLAAWRQNGRLLVDGGEVTDRARQGGLGWGATVDLQAETWRSGLGLSADRRTLLYAVGDGLTAERLAEVLRAAGAATALQLDINNYWVRFVTFQRDARGRLIGVPLISAMPDEPRKYLVPDKRDFFYLTAK